MWEFASGIGSEAGILSVAKGRLLASVAIAKGRAGLLAEWGSGSWMMHDHAPDLVFECIIFLCVVE